MILTRQNRVLANRGGNALAPKTPPLIGDLILASHGDSISHDQGTSNYIFTLANLIASGQAKMATIRPRGINGISWNFHWVGEPYPLTMIDDAPGNIDQVRRVDIPSWLILFAGTNGIAIGGHDATTEVADFQDYVEPRLVSGWPAARMPVCTMLPRTGVDEGVRDDYNAGLITAAEAAGCPVVRLDLNANIGAAGQNLNSTWFYDGIHPTVAGQDEIAQEIYEVMFP
jgi:hypothetical protein